MDLNFRTMDNDFNEFWEAYKPNEIRFPRRRAATFLAWNERTQAARKAMLAKVKAEGAPEWKNPYFYVVDFPEPQPTNYNGRELPKIPLVLARYKGQYGIFSTEEAENFGMTEVKPFN